VGAIGGRIAGILAGRAGTFPVMRNKVGIWLEQSGRESVIVEIPDQWTNIRDYLLENGWKRQYTWV
jgi:hypothetical protein